ncbi:hypothetical protein SDRG_00900 [Saprolegnia diclina VS20]|uniref:TsaA-like domain-containing protein n=1 Tax=Saprolegnia diclina (strain VS20) TaxID=1156394 RepID=T0SGL3_SAPDV|nr:hypothetical protein SDRG_00900 [Saprolegnia diclina VS20]EQC42057.1 hypothetical protein SDRG_00900 [Saprolegnia diclina VS20]|eukprot:XP_008604626.1 hypothetical protein SDRG_00900 [Saprolegnia diclina VS20]
MVGVSRAVVATAVASALSTAIAVYYALHHATSKAAKAELKDLGKKERDGRVRLQIALGSAQDKIKALEAALQSHGVSPQEILDLTTTNAKPKRGAKKDVVVPLLTVQTIGAIASPYSTRNGTPRQPSLVTTSVAKLQLHKHIPPSALLSLAEFSHVWVVFHFHQNTNVHKPTAQVKATIKPPRLNGAAVGVLATRSPHRPAPIGLSLAKVIAVNADEGYVLFQGLDLVHGTPVVDIKPYVAFSDTPSDAFAPAWVGKEHADGDEPLAITHVSFDDGAADVIASAFQACKATRSKLCAIDLFPTLESFVAFVQENLRLDMRSTRERVDPKFDDYRVTLCDIVISYRMTQPGPGVAIMGADVVTDATAQPRNE